MSRTCNSSGEYSIVHLHLSLILMMNEMSMIFENRVEIFRNSDRTCFFKNNKNPSELYYKDLHTWEIFSEIRPELQRSISFQDTTSIRRGDESMNSFLLCDLSNILTAPAMNLTPMPG